MGSYPISLVKTRQQIEPASQRKGTFRQIGRIARTEGPRALWSGFPVTIVGAIPAQVLYLTAMETSKLPVTKIGREVGLDETKVALVANLVGGFIASLASQIVVVPVDVVSQKWVVFFLYLLVTFASFLIIFCD